jgi:hypothetical protein
MHHALSIRTGDYAREMHRVLFGSLGQTRARGHVPAWILWPRTIRLHPAAANAAALLDVTQGVAWRRIATRTM